MRAVVEQRPASALLAATAHQASRDADDIPVTLEDVSAQERDGQPWVAVAALAADPGAWAEAAIDLGRLRIGRIDQKSLGAHLAGQLGRAVSPLAAALGAGRLIDPAGAWLSPSIGVFDPYPALAVGGCTVAVARDDPAAAEADAVVAGDDALQNRFCAGLVVPVLRPALDAIHERSTFARRAGEALAVEWMLRAFVAARSRRTAGWQEDAALLADRMGLARKLVPTFVRVAAGPHVGFVTDGGACCRYDQWPQGELCDFCTLKPLDDRLTLWHAEVAEMEG